MDVSGIGYLGIDRVLRHGNGIQGFQQCLVFSAF